MNEADPSGSMENARVEYAATNEVYMHYDNFSWQVGSVLLAGVFVYWGFIIADPPPFMILVIGNLLVCGLMTSWFLYSVHNRQIYRLKLHRIYELERLLGMEQHTRFYQIGGQRPVYDTDGPGGHVLDLSVYLLVSIGGLIPGLVQHNWDCEDTPALAVLILTTTLIVLSIIHSQIVERRTTAQLQRLDRVEAKAADD